MARILVIDDDPMYRTVLRRFIEEKGHTVIEAEDANAGLKVFLEEKIDLVVSDLIMPEKSGMELLQELRAIKPDALVIMVTGFPTVEIATAAMKAGAYDFLVKPVDIDQLTAVMHRALSTVQLRSRLSTVRGMNMALLISIPFWIALGILARVFLFR